MGRIDLLEIYTFLFPTVAGVSRACETIMVGLMMLLQATGRLGTGSLLYHATKGAL